MSWLHLVVLGAAGGLAAMTVVVADPSATSPSNDRRSASLERMQSSIEAGDVDEAIRQGQLAGPVIVERALASRSRATRLAAIAAAPGVEGRSELLVGLAHAAAGPDRRIAIPAATSARAIARELQRAAERDELSDDHAAADLVTWRDAWAERALDRERWIELRVLALDVTAALELAIARARAREGERAEPGIGVSIEAALADPDPAFRRAAIEVVPVPTPHGLRATLAAAVVRDTDPRVALAAAQALCADLVADPAAPILDALGEPGLQRIRTLVTLDDAPVAVVRDAARCLRADPSPASRAALRAIAGRVR